jgi:hypothetical protein
VLKVLQGHKVLYKGLRVPQGHKDLKELKELRVLTRVLKEL